jgi:hypothetical protein
LKEEVLDLKKSVEHERKEKAQLLITISREAEAPQKSASLIQHEELRGYILNLQAQKESLLKEASVQQASIL